MMLKNTKIYFFLFYLLTTIHTHAQNTVNSDSLMLDYKGSKKDTALVNKMNRFVSTIIFSNPQEGLFISEKARTLSLLLNYSKGQAESNLNMGYLNNALASFEKAIPFFERAIILYKQINDQENLSVSIKSCADAYAYTGNLKKAHELYLQALDVARGTSNKENQARIMNALGASFRDLNHYNKALSFHLEALSLDKEINNYDGQAREYINIGNLFIKQSNYDKALKYYTEGLKIGSKINIYYYSQLLNNTGNSYIGLKQYDKALEYINKSLKLREEKKSVNKSGMAENYGNIGFIYLKQKKYKEAELNFLNALKIVKELDDIQDLMSCLKLNIEYLIETKKYEEAEKNINELLQLSGKNNHSENIAYCYSNLGYVYQSKNNYKKACEYFLKSFEINEKLWRSESRKRVEEMEVVYETEKKESQMQLFAAEAKNEKQTKNIIIISFVFALIIGSLVYMRYRTKQKLLLANKEIKMQQEKIDLEQKLLTSQMNPHFIFNSLNSIKFFIRKNNIEKSEEYLNDFANLTRLILESSRKELISLRDDIKTLQFYLKLEKLRANDSFNYDFNCSDGVLEVDDLIKIPPMLLQPFVENSIKHGFNALNGKTGQLNLIYDIDEKNNLIIHIIDNGSGRNILIENKETKHQSLATIITNERIRLFKDKYKQEIVFKIEDLVDNANNPAGTKVIFIIPAIHDNEYV